MRKIKEEFKSFVKEYNAVGIAVGIVMGSAVTKVVSSIVSDIVMPFLAVLIPAKNWREIEFGYGNLHLKVGNFLGSLIDFAIIALVIFIFVKKIFREKV